MWEWKIQSEIETLIETPSPPEFPFFLHIQCVLFHWWKKGNIVSKKLWRPTWHDSCSMCVDGIDGSVEKIF